MPLLLSNPEGFTVEFDVDGYQFPSSKDHWDSNWLYVKGNVHHPRGSWTFRDPSLTTFELEQLAAWFRQLRPLSSSIRPCFFTEPCLTFSFADEPEPTINLALSHECSPPWLQGQERLDGISMSFPTKSTNPGHLEGAVLDMLKKFPVRSA
ncbi:WapI family immunity protein [Silvimonas amylolytica]|uniref:WapI family immunity protein n=1 Tax=Silvimonas amylolytica TaxID=449663 RepID=UPI004032DCE5